MKYDVVVIGSGPAGLTAAIYTGRGGLKTAVVTGQESGGQLMMTTEVENFPGFPEGIVGPELMQRVIDQAKRFGAEMIDDVVAEIKELGKGFSLSLVSGKKLETEAVILATGASAKWLGVPGEKRLRGKVVSACATCDGFFFKDKVVTVVGGGDVAMEEALFLTKFAKKVRIIHRRDKFRASKIMQDRVFANDKIEIVWDTVVEEVLGEEKLEGLKVKNVKTGKEEVLPTDGLFVAIGHKPNTEFVKGLIELDEKGYIVTSKRVMEEYAWLVAGKKTFIAEEKLEECVKSFDFRYEFVTSKVGIWAAGDVVDYRYRQAVTAAGMGCAAALEVMEWREKGS